MAEHDGREHASHPITEKDREDLLTLLNMRFGSISDEVLQRIRDIEDVSQIDHLILVAANAVTWTDFIQEAREPGFRIVGQGFDPLSEDAPVTETRRDRDGQ
jgi:hypothetical protein